MGFVEAVRTCFCRYIQFSGRARRPEYWWFMLFLTLGGLVGWLVDAALGFSDGGPFGALFSLATLLPTFAVTWRRLHDIGRPGYLALLPLIGLPIVALGAALDSVAFLGVAMATMGAVYILLIVWLASRSQAGENRFGPEPPTL